MSCTLKRGAIALLLIFIPICHAVLVNRTIDSNLGDSVTNFQPIYHATPGEDEWDDETCTKCNINPDPAAAFDNTYMSATYFPHGQPLEGINITLQFTGVAVWVFFILSNTNIHGNPFVSTHCNFTLDGQHAGSFSHEPDSTTYAFMYNVPVFSQNGLSNTPHELIVSVNDFPIPTWLCFDYAIYTSQTDGGNPSSAISSSATIGSSSTATASSAASKSSPSVDPSNTVVSSLMVTPSTFTNSSTTADSQSTTQTPKTGAIVGGIIGALALIGILIVLAFIRRRRSRQLDNGPIPDAFLNTGITPTSSEYLYTNDSQRGGRLQTHIPTVADNGSYMPSPSGVAPISVNSDRGGEKRLPMRQANIVGRSPVLHQSSGVPNPEAQNDIASLHGQIQELRDQMQQLQNQQQSSGTLTSSDAQSPPPYR